MESTRIFAKGIAERLSAQDGPCVDTTTKHIPSPPHPPWNWNVAECLLPCCLKLLFLSGVRVDRLTATELVRSKKAKERLLQARVQIHSVQMQLQQNLGSYCVSRWKSSKFYLAMLKIGNCIQKSARVTQIMNNLIRVWVVGSKRHFSNLKGSRAGSNNATTNSRNGQSTKNFISPPLLPLIEVPQAGLLEEMMEDTFDTLDEDVAEEDVSEEVDRVATFTITCDD